MLSVTRMVVCAIRNDTHVLAIFHIFVGFVLFTLQWCGRCKQGYINDGGRCVADTYGIGHKNAASCSYMEAGSVVELSDATFLQMLQVSSLDMKKMSQKLILFKTNLLVIAGVFAKKVAANV
jgi:hypothetical protein